MKSNIHRSIKYIYNTNHASQLILQQKTQEARIYTHVTGLGINIITKEQIDP